MVSHGHQPTRRILRSVPTSNNTHDKQQEEHDELSLTESAARHIIDNQTTEEERDALPRKENQSYIELYSELEDFRAPRVFDQLIGRAISDPICYNNDDRSLHRVRPIWSGPGGRRFATYGSMDRLFGIIPLPSFVRIYAVNPVMSVYDLVDQRYVLIHSPF